MRFRPCIDIHNGKSKTDRRRKLKRQKEIRQRKILSLHRMRHFCRDVSERPDKRRTCDFAECKRFSVL